jgi:hypothetical protein
LTATTINQTGRRVRLLYERAVFGGDRGAVAAAEQELDGVEADLALARRRGDGAVERHGRSWTEAENIVTSGPFPLRAT